MFYSESNKPKTIPAPSGDKFRTKYKRTYDEKTGNEKQIENGKTNVYEKIQKYKESCDIYKILDRYENGEEAAEAIKNGLIVTPNHKEGFYGDISEMPKTIGEAIEQQEKAAKAFQSLPRELQKILKNKGRIEEKDLKEYINNKQPKEETEGNE